MTSFLFISLQSLPDVALTTPSLWTLGLSTLLTDRVVFLMCTEKVQAYKQLEKRIFKETLTAYLRRMDYENRSTSSWHGLGNSPALLLGPGWGWGWLPMTICKACGLRNPTPLHTKRRCDDRIFITKMERFGYARVPARCLTRAFKEAGGPVVHGAITMDRTGNWVPKWFLDVFLASCAGKKLYGLPPRLQVHKVVLRVTRSPIPPAAAVPLGI